MHAPHMKYPMMQSSVRFKVINVLLSPFFFIRETSFQFAVRTQNFTLVARVFIHRMTTDVLMSGTSNDYGGIELTTQEFNRKS